MKVKTLDYMHNLYKRYRKSKQYLFKGYVKPNVLKKFRNAKEKSTVAAS